MDRFELETAFYKHLVNFSHAGFVTIRPDEIFDPADEANQSNLRRGVLMLNRPETIAFGDGIYSRIDGMYQIDLWVPLDVSNAYQTLMNASSAHVDRFFPANGRGLSLTEGTTTAHIVRRPSQERMPRESGFIREMVEVDFYVDVRKDD